MTNSHSFPQGTSGAPRNRFVTKLLLTTILSCGFPIQALAQSQPPSNPANPPNPYNTIDANGVNLATGEFNFSFGQVSTGGSQGEALGFAMQWYGAERRDLTLGWMQLVSGVYYVSFGGSTETFTESGGVFTSEEGTGSTLSFNSGTGIYTYALTNGTAYEFDDSIDSDYPEEDIIARVTEITEASGIVTTFHYLSVTDVFDYEGHTVLVRGDRVQSITNNLGYQLHIDYLQDSITSDTSLIQWNRVSGVIAINNAEEYCSPTANSCTLTEDWPEVTFAYAGTAAAPTSVAATDNLNRTITVSLDTALRIVGITRPETGDEPIDVDYDVSGRVSSYDDGAGVWGYSYAFPGGTVLQTTIDPPVGGNVVAEFDPPQALRPTSVTNGTGDETTYEYDSSGRLIETTMPEGNSIELTYDSNGNVTETRANAKSGSGLADIVTSATYPCSSGLTCNRPSTTTDALGNVTNYDWSTTHGGLLEVTAPAPSTGAARPETRFTYAQQYARYKNSSGTVVDAPSQVYRLTRTESCATGTSCDGAANETESVLNYGAGTSAATNLLLAQNITRAGNSSVSAVTGYSYDAFGNLEVFDGPVSDDDITYFYNSGIQLAGSIGMDPDGASEQARLAIRYDYDDNGNATNVESGTASAATRDALNAMTVTQSQIFDYDSIGRRITARQRSASNVTQARVDYQYDTASRLLCQAVRMNDAIFDSLTAAGCSLGTQGSLGSDRISYTHYDNANRVNRVQIGYGTSDVANAHTRTYGSNGQLATLDDGEGNRTTYEYDGFQRLVKMRYPNASGSGSSTSDYISHVYNSVGELTQTRLRDARTINFTYDDLGRRTTLNLPGSDPDVTYGYDNFGRMISASQTGHSLSFTFDALGRQLTETGPLGTVTSAYASHRGRSQLTHPDGHYIYYSYHGNGALNAIRFDTTSGTANRIGYTSYDSANRMTRWTAGASPNQAIESFGYDAAERLSDLDIALPGTSADAAIDLAYNPAGQISERSQDNDVYNWAGASEGATTYTDNGLNQYTSVTGSVAPAYDSRGNLTGFDGGTYVYDSLNRLTSATVASQTTSFTYDPLGRLYGVDAEDDVHDARFLWDGWSLIAEYALNNATVLRRHVHGGSGSLGAPVATFGGASVATTNLNTLTIDERGSVIAITQASDGTVVGPQAYGAYGEAQSNNTGRFRYAGQISLGPNLPLYMRNRYYSPELGRFMTTDPIGYAGGMNLYGYVGNDPVNFVDPLGLIRDSEMRWLTAPYGNVNYGDNGGWYPEIVVTGQRPDPCAGTSFCTSGGSLDVVGGSDPLGQGLDTGIGETGEVIVVTACGPGATQEECQEGEEEEEPQSPERPRTRMIGGRLVVSFENGFCYRRSTWREPTCIVTENGNSSVFGGRPNCSACHDQTPGDSRSATSRFFDRLFGRRFPRAGHPVTRSDGSGVARASSGR